MIGSHNTFTFLPAKKQIFNQFSRYWKCQCANLQEQLRFGVRILDLRLRYVGMGDESGLYIACHGIVDLDSIAPLWYWVYFVNNCRKIYANTADVLLRIVLERGSRLDKERFIEEAKKVMKETGCFVWRFDIRSRGDWKGLEECNNNDYYYDKGYKFAKGTTWGAPAHELHGYVSVKNWYKVSLKDEAKRINAALPFFQDNDKLQEMIEDKTTLYFLDYATNQYK